MLAGPGHGSPDGAFAIGWQSENSEVPEGALVAVAVRAWPTALWGRLAKVVAKGTIRSRS